MSQYVFNFLEKKVEPNAELSRRTMISVPSVNGNSCVVVTTSKSLRWYLFELSITKYLYIFVQKKKWICIYSNATLKCYSKMLAIIGKLYEFKTKEFNKFKCLMRNITKMYKNIELPLSYRLPHWSEKVNSTALSDMFNLEKNTFQVSRWYYPYEGWMYMLY